MATSSLRDKFKLLRQWQMQQQEEFEKIKMEHSMKFTTYENSSIDQISEPLPFSNDRKDLEKIENVDDIGQAATEYKGESVPSADQNLLKRMSSNSLEQALTLAVNELKSQNGIIAESDENDLQHSNESSDHEGIGNAYFANDSWDGNAKLQTAIFKENLHRSTANVELFSDGEAASEGASDMDGDMDGFYPITYSEDNASEGKTNISDDNHDDEADDDNYNDKHLDEDKMPFDEKPVQSMIRQGIVSFEEMIERQLEDEKKAKDEKHSIENNPAPQKKFLRKGEGTARFNRGMKPAKGAKVGYMKEHGSAPLPKTTLKLIAEPSLRVGKAAETLSNDGQLSEELNLKKEAWQDKHLVMGNLPRQDLSYQRPLPSDSIGFQRHSASTVDSSIEASFQNMLKTKYTDDKVADDELAEFELLEKAALDTSISSNASSILKLVSASKSKFLKLNTSSPIPKSHLLNQDVELENDVEENLEKSDDGLSITEEDADIERRSSNEHQIIASTGQRKESDRIPTYMNREGFDMNEDQFLDHSEWDDTVHSSDALEDGDSTIVRSPKVEKAPDTSEPRARDSPPPTSQLMKKYFPTLASKEKTAKQSQNKKSHMQKSKENFSVSTKDNLQPNTGKENMPPSLQTGVLKSKLAELEHEISRFQKENATLEKLRVEKEKELNNLKNEVEQFQLQRAAELEKIEKCREEEMQKLRREKKTFEKYQKAVRSAPNKKEREEIETLKKKVNQLEEDLKHREKKWNSSASRFRKRIEDLENENYELKESIKLLEKERISRWGNADSKSMEVKERRANKLPTAGVKQAVTGALVGSDPSQKCVDHRLEIIPVTTKIKSTSMKSVSPRDETVKTKIVGKSEVSPRVDIAPSEHPEIPRGSEEYSTRDVTDKAHVRLSLTPERKQPSVEKTLQINSQMKHQDGKVERLLPDGSREVIFPNGTRKTIDPTTHHTVVSFFNGDIKQIFPDDRTTYFYAESKTTHTTYKDGTEVYEFANGQSEKHYPDGRKVITFHDQTVKCIFADGAEETVFADGTIQNVDISGQRTISFPNGQREIHTQNFKRREYPDGTVKTVYQDGRQETRYSTGRIRIKDQFGNLVLDSGLS